jgi:hypothetical protein
MKSSCCIFVLIYLWIALPLSAQVKVVRDAKTKQARAVEITPLPPVVEKYDAFVWPSETPSDCPFVQSEALSKIEFLGIKSGFHFADTWYPTWGDDDLLYSPYTDGVCWRLDGRNDHSWSGGEGAVTGQGAIEGDDPLNMVVYSLGTEAASPKPYQGRYPCGSLMYNGVWYYGTYCLAPDGSARFGDKVYNWPWLGPFVGFRISKDKGIKWTACPHKPEKPIFPETGLNGYHVRIVSPHFVDVGKNMQ